MKMLLKRKLGIATTVYWFLLLYIIAALVFCLLAIPACAEDCIASVYAIVFDEVPQRVWEFVIGSWWLLGVVMQISAGLIGRSRPVNKAIG